MDIAMDRLNSELLRTFIAIAETGSVTGGAELIGRSQSAASLQIKQIEACLGRPVFDRHGRGVGLTSAGERLLPVAREVLQRLDRTVSEIQGTTLAGRLRLGLPGEYGQETLSRIVAAFADAHPQVELEVRSALSTGFPRALETGALDLAVHEVPEPGSGMELLRADELRWMTASAHGAERREPLPVALFDRACWWRDAALQALETAGRTYRIVYSSESMRGVLGAVEAGIAVSLLGAHRSRQHLKPVAELEGEAPVISHLVLQRRPEAGDAATLTMAAAIRRAFET